MSKLLSEILRPQTFDQLILPDQIKKKFIKMKESQNVMNMLFYGRPGSGKTTAAKIFCDSEYFEFITLNGSLDTSIEDIRSKVKNFVSSCSLYSLPKIVFIDEADYLSKNAQASLRNMIEDCSDNCRFIFTANDIKKFQHAILSRLLAINFDMTLSQINEALEIYKSNLLNKLKENYDDFNEEEIIRTVDMNYPDYRAIASKIEFYLI